MGRGVEKLLDIDLDNPLAPLVQARHHIANGLMRCPPWTKPVTGLRKPRLEIGLKPQTHRLRHDPVTYRRDREPATTSIGFGNVDATPWLGHVGVVLEGRLERLQLLIQVCLESLKALAIHAPRPVVRLDQRPGSPQIRQVPDLVDQRADFRRMAILRHAPSFLTRVPTVKISTGHGSEAAHDRDPIPRTRVTDPGVRPPSMRRSPSLVSGFPERHCHYGTARLLTTHRVGFSASALYRLYSPGQDRTPPA